MPMPVSIEKTEIPGVLVVRTGMFTDARGFFSESYSQRMWDEAGFAEPFVQDNLSKSSKGVLRGMHYQIEPHGMGKLVRVVRGAIFDVGIDIRRGSPTYGRWIGRELNGDDGLALYLPPGLAHGFVALEDDTYVYYKCTAMHEPASERAILYNDAEVGIAWPLEPSVVSQKDAAAPPLAQAETNFRYNGR